MDRKYNVGVIGTSAPHFPIRIAEKTFEKCLRVLKDDFKNEFNFFALKKIVTDTVNFDDNLISFKKRNLDILILVQGAFTWDNISVYLYEFFGSPPTILWAVPEKIIDGEVLGTNSLCGIIMNNSAFHKLGVRNFVFYGSPKDVHVLRQIGGALKTISCALTMKNAKFGMIGYRPTGFYNSTFDEMKIRRELGIETVYYDLCDLLNNMDEISKQDVLQDLKKAKSLGKIERATKQSLETASKTYLAIKDFVDREKIDFLGIQCWPVMMKKNANPCMVLGRLIEDNIPAACESDFGGALSMAMAMWLSGGAAWLADLIDINEKNGSFYFWHCGAAPRSLAHERDFPVINRQFRGSDRGNTLEFILKEGEVTVVRFGITDNKLRIFAFEGNALFPDNKVRGNVSEVVPKSEPGQILKKIVDCGIEHHLAVVYGRHLESFKELARLLKIDFYSA